MKKKVLLFLACVWLICSFLVIRVTYAKYVSSIGSNTNVDIESWKIVLNTQDITNSSNFTENLNLVFPGDNYYVANRIVPGAVRIF